MDLYEIIFDEQEDEFGIMALGFVDAPAIDVDVLKFNDVKVEQFKKNELKKQITGPYMVPNKKMLRMHGNGNEYEVFYSAETIEKYANRMFKNQYFNNINIHHEDPDDSSYLTEHWIKTSDSDKSNDLGFDLPVGTAFMTYQLTDEMFNKFESGELNGLSIELLIDKKNYKQMTEKENKFKKFYSMVENFFKLEEDFEEEAPSAEDVVEQAVEKTEEAPVEEVKTEEEAKVEEVVEEAIEKTEEAKPEEEAKEEPVVDNTNEALKHMTDILAKMNDKLDQLESKNEELEKKLKTTPAEKPIEQVETKKPYKEMSLAEEITAKLKAHVKRTKQ